MLRKTMVALLAVASLGILTIDTASARGGFGGGGFHGGGFGGGGFRGGGFGGFRGGGFGGGGFRGAAFSGGGFRSAAIGAGGFRAAGFRGGFYRPGFGYRSGWGYRRGFPFAAAAIGVGLGYGLYGGGPYGYYDYGDPYYGYYDDYGYGDGGCYVVQRRVLTSYGWRIQPVQVCD